MKSTTIFIYCLLIILPLKSIHAQLRNDLHSQYSFKSITVDDGLGHNRVRGLGQDSYGFIWISTRTGVYKYDGYTITPYEHFLSDTTFEEFQETRDIFNDSKGNLWVAGLYGICKFNSIEDRFEEFFDNENKDEFITSGGIREDSEGLIWFTLRHMFGCYNPTTEEFTYFSKKTNSNFPIESGNPTRLIVGKNDNVYVSYDDAGLLVYDKKANKISWYEEDGMEGSLGENLIERLYEDPDGNIWIGYNNNGFSRFDPETEYFKTYFPDSTIKQSGRVRGLQKDLLGNFWIGTQAGLYLFNEDTETAIRYAHSAHPVSELSHNSIQTILLDDQEQLWLGTYAGGVNYTSLITSGFIKYSYTPFNSPYFLNDKNVYSIGVDKTGDLWLGTENGGLNHLERKSGKFTYYSHDPNNPNSPLSNNIKDIVFDKDDNIWFASYGGGFSFFNRKTGEFTHTVKSKDNPDGFPEKRVYTLLLNPINDDILFVGGRNGIYIYEISTGNYQKVSPEMEGYVNAPELTNQINDIVNYKNERIYIVSDKVTYLDLYTNTFKTVSDFEGSQLSNTNFIFVDRLDQVWFDYKDDVLIKSDLDLNDFQVFSHENGLPQAIFLEAADDDYGNLWLSSNIGIIKLENILNQNDSIVSHVYKKSDNLQSQEFLYHSAAQSEYGEIYFGGINGFNSFFPSMVTGNPYPPNPYITQLRVQNKLVSVGEKVLGRVILKEPIIDAEQIKIHPRVKSFSIEFTGLHYASAENNSFKYILEGYDNNWTETSAEIRFASFSNLPPGKYTFKVLAANYSGEWCEEPAKLDIRVIRPVYMRWWFILIILTGLGFAVRMFIILRENQLKHDKKLLEEKISEAEETLKAQQEEVEIQRQELDEKEEAEKVSKWRNEGIGLFSGILSKQKDDLDKLSSELISNCVSYLGALQGGIFIMNDSDPDNVILELAAGYAFNADGDHKKTFYPGEGMVGMCFQQKEIIQEDNLPDSYAKLTSGLGEAPLKHIVLIPLKRDDLILGVIELASTNKLEDYKIEFLESISENIVSVLYSLRSNKLITKMLEQSQEQGEMLKAQEEEMRQTMEEMNATQEESTRREENLIKEIDKLKEELEKSKKS